MSMNLDTNGGMASKKYDGNDKLKILNEEKDSSGCSMILTCGEKRKVEDGDNLAKRTNSTCSGESSFSVISPNLLPNWQLSNHRFVPTETVNISSGTDNKPILKKDTSANHIKEVNSALRGTAGKYTTVVSYILHCCFCSILCFVLLNSSFELCFDDITGLTRPDLTFKSTG